MDKLKRRDEQQQQIAVAMTTTSGAANERTRVNTIVIAIRATSLTVADTTASAAQKNVTSRGIAYVKRSPHRRTVSTDKTIPSKR